MFTFKNTLVFLYKILNRFIPTQCNRYQYNYNYLEPLAMTDIPELPIINFPLLPKDELPSAQWLGLLLTVITILNLNNTSKSTHGNAKNIPNSDSQTDQSFLDNKLSSLKNINNNISTIRDQEDSDDYLNSYISDLLLTLKQIDDNLNLDEQIHPYLQQRLFEQANKDIKVVKVEKQFTDLLNKNPQPVVAKSNKESTKAFFKEIIKYNAKLLELAEHQTPIAETSVEISKNSENGLEDFDKQFRVISKPEIANKFQEDLVFAYMQVAGPNPVMLKQIKQIDPRLPITDEKYQEIITQIAGIADSLEAAIQEGRLYLADYDLLNNLVDGSFPQAQKYVAAPIALFAVPPLSSSSRYLLPIAISCQQSIFTPLETGTWMTAKNIVQMADSNYHELVSHLGRTHLVIEPFIVATNHLPNNHLIKQLLKPHLQGTVLINYGAHKSLIAPKGIIDSLLVGTIESEQKLAIKAAQSYLFNFHEVAFPDTLNSRGVNNADQLPIYPYRDDGTLIWNAIYKWVYAYLSYFYTNDGLIFADKNLQRWSGKLASPKGGRLKNFGEDAEGKIKTLDYLVKTISTIIFTASAQHAAVNFPQRGMMIYTPAFPFARYTPAPTNSQESEDFINGLPSLEKAQEQINILYLLGSLYYTKLGEYPTSISQGNQKLKVALQDFHQDLQEIEQRINQRNSERMIAYKYLLPSRIPQSINI
ncbi:lipoxygenase [Anabaena cylindrica FACHB-243]|uniref:Arachidonate 15-lipoxygenase n=1 Tax=Anabaena cylindrica (strain ATCC 27899 / PCC 7122) TaxID=272123 RepID=K9ZHH3_ANACC|nr:MULTISPECIES: lipoxygenase family protein [Anabaena]AFZ57795.1 Arachidonate 15-lipoxygenase [Anabaena cylindrica PCC 7122]MBD2419295.1 lipoxygenase [Anabaena cylindrica FACHB-243]MBY5281363.1 lipoxygenase [Anabaena sp. CCAP 1446/1C]MBY5308397.1 lipoxygenase [Anabaena sp. CCAP 1446/1C]MCM2408103.1 lipoxygenase [Anabaena sp. CCAP 1446/1C]